MATKKPHLRLHYQPDNAKRPWWIECKNFPWTPSYATSNRRTVPEVMAIVEKHCQPGEFNGYSQFA